MASTETGRFFIGKFKKNNENEIKLTEVKGAFVLVALDEGEDQVTVVYSNTDLKKNAKCSYFENQLAPATERMAYVNKPRKGK
jgi:hypothetical protein